MTPHALVSVDGIGEARWSVCRCGWVSPVVADRRTAVQAHQAHEEGER